MITAEALRVVVREAPVVEPPLVTTKEFILVPNKVVALLPQTSPISDESLAREYQSAGSAMFNLMHDGLYATNVSLSDMVKRTVAYKDELKKRGLPRPHLNLVPGPKRVVSEDGYLSFEYPNLSSDKKQSIPSTFDR